MTTSVMTMQDATHRTIAGLEVCVRNKNHERLTAGEVHVYISNISYRTGVAVEGLPRRLKRLYEKSDKLVNSEKACSKEFDTKQVLESFKRARK